MAKVNIYLLDFVSPREFRRQQTAKVKYILGLGLPLWLSLWGGGGVHLWQVVRSMPFARLPALLAVSLANMALFRVLRGFLEGFMVRMYICMG